MFASYKEEEKEDGDPKADYSAIKIHKYNRVLNICEERTEIKLGARSYFDLIMQKSKIYILGGSSNNIALKSVSSLLEESKYMETRDISLENYSQVSVFDLDSGEEELLPEMNSIRRCFTSILLGKCIYVFGGWNGTEI